MQLNRRQVLLAALATPALPLALPAQAQSKYPSKPIRVVVPWVVGVPSDIATRSVTERMAEELKQPFVVDNKTGATGTVAIPEVLRQPADGYTIYSLNSASLLGPLLYPAANIDFFRDFIPVGSIDTSASVLVTAVNQPFNTIEELIEAARKRPNSLTYASAGSGSPPHVVAEQFKIQAKVKIKHIPYAQISQLVVDLIAGRVDIGFMGAPLAIPQVKGGRLKALGINTRRRSANLPDVPTFEDSGVQGMDIRAFDGFLVKKGTPPEVVERLSASLQNALNNPAVQKTLTEAGLELLPMKAAEFRVYLQAESQRLTNLARQIGVKTE